MKFYDFIAELNESELESYAAKCGTTARYIRNHLKLAKKVPRPALLNALWQQSGGKLSREDIHDHFMPAEVSAA